MSVLQRKDLEDSPLADLHAIASELGVEGFRGKRKADLVNAILRGQDGNGDGDHDEAPADEPVAEEPAAREPEEDEDDAEDEDAASPVEEEPEVVDEPQAEEEIVAGVLDILPNGSGFVRVDPAVHSRGDVYVSPAQIRRCELRSGDEVSGPVRPARRNERHPSLIHVETVNGGPAEPPAERPAFGELTAVFPSERLPGPPSIASVPFGRGSRVAISGPAGAGATTLLREIVAALSEADSEVPVHVALAGARPEEVAEWAATGADVVGGSFDSSPEAQGQAAELAVERAKRRVERGAHAVVVLDSLEVLAPAARRRVFGAGRNTEEGGSLTVIAVTGDTPEALRWATTRIVLGSAEGDAATPQVSAASGTLRADLL